MTTTICLLVAHGRPEACANCECDKVLPVPQPERIFCAFGACRSKPLRTGITCWNHSDKEQRYDWLAYRAGFV